MIKQALTARYVEALIQEGDDFSPGDWHRRIQLELGRHKNRSEQSASAKHPEPDKGAAPIPPLIGELGEQTKGETIEHELFALEQVWEDVQSSRRRDSIYTFLDAVFLLIHRHKKRKKKKRLHLALSKRLGKSTLKPSNLYSAVIRAALGRDEVDPKTVSKWSRALRYAQSAKPRYLSLRDFMKQLGGINRCAAAFGNSCKK